MTKAVFLDYTGTIIQESGSELREVVRRVSKNSQLNDPNEVMKVWWTLLKDFEESSYGDNYLTEDEIVDKAFAVLVRDYQLNENLDELHALIQGYWVNAPLFPDVEEFFQKCPVPIYVISNNGEKFVKRAMEQNRLTPKGIISADMVKAYKPHKEIFEKALEISKMLPEEVVHIGDSYQSDVQGALSANISPILVDRKGNQEYPGILTVKSLTQAL